MKNLTRVFLATFLLVQIAGCAFLHSFDSDLDTQIDEWLAQHEYTKVLDTLKYIRPSHPKYQLLQKKRQQAIDEAKRFEQQQISKANDYIKEEKWHQAEMTLNNAMEKLPDSKPLQTAYQDFIKQRAQVLKSLYYQLYINKAEWLVKNKNVQQELTRTIPDDKKTKQAMEDYKKETQHVYQQLVICGLEATNINDLELAEQCYMLANELQPSTSLQKTLGEIEDKLGQTQKRKPMTLSSQGRTLLEQSKQAMSKGDLKLALSTYKKISPSDRSHPLIKAYSQEMNHRIHDNVNQGIELGRKLYSQGEVEQALAVWNKLRELDPDNEYLLNHIERAEHVLEKVSDLRKQQKQEPAPQQPDTSN